ncbi:MAG TPA: hypothetical protein VJ785_08730 [Anaerolineales bacterium]|nr:hypothetical protein [Anaerolineales bacterium]
MELSLIFQIISTSAVLLGILFGILNLRNFQKMRKREAAILMLNSFQTTEFVRGLLVVFSLPDRVGRDEIESLPKEDYLAFYVLLGTWERLGILVYHHEIPLELVEEAFSGAILTCWEKLQAFILQFRADVKREAGFEWFQWLVERIQERGQTAAVPPAYIAHKEWKEKSEYL